jgi:hypothetical protein
VTHQEDAERIREHLVHLRGGSPFLSPDDAVALVSWLDAGVPVARILRGLDVAAKKRREQRKRAPLCLRHAKPWLGRPRDRAELAAPVLFLAEDDHPLMALAASLRARDSDGGPTPRRCDELAQTLLALPDDDHLAEEAIARVAAWFDACWRAHDPGGRARWQARAEAELGDILDLLADEERDEIVEEHARGLFRDSIPGCDATTILQLLS